MDANQEKHVVGEQMTIRHLFTMTAGFTMTCGQSLLSDSLKKVMDRLLCVILFLDL